MADRGLASGAVTAEEVVSLFLQVWFPVVISEVKIELG